MGRGPGHQRRTGFGTGFHLVPVDSDDEIGPRREVSIDGSYAGSGSGGNVPHRRIHPRVEERRGGGVQQCLLVAPGINPLMRSWRAPVALSTSCTNDFPGFTHIVLGLSSPYPLSVARWVADEIIAATSSSG
jgi:hypothetical protein